MSIKETLLEALELDKKEDWHQAHLLVQSLENEYAHWIHAYLHRKEPDLSNASYWYSRAGKPMPEYEFEQEWNEIYEAIRKTRSIG